MKQALLLAAASAVTSAQATVIDSLPYNNSADWTVIVFDGTSMSAGANTTTLTTAQGRGVWFGWGVWYGDQPNSWAPGGSASGNLLNLTASFSHGSADWSAYFYDRQHYAAWQFNPTRCSDNCYSTPAFAGVEYTYATPDAPNKPLYGFVPLDLTQTHRFDFLLKNGQVSYAIDGQLVYNGTAYQVSLSAPLLVIGDGSGSSRTGVGSMTIYDSGIDTAPTVSVVPEPGTYALMLGGLGLLALRRRSR